MKKLLDDPDTYLALHAAEVLGKVGPNGMAVLIGGLRDKDVARRRLIAESLIRSGPAGKEIIPPLTVALKDPDCEVRLRAAMALLRIDPDNEAIIPTLVELLAENDRRIKHLTIVSLYRVARRATAAIPALIAILEQESSEWALTDDCIMQAFGQMGSAAKDAVPVLTKRLHDRQNLAGPIIAAQALAKIGPAAKSAYPDLQSVVADTNQIFELRAKAANFRLRVESAKALWRIDHEAKVALPYLIWVLQSKTPWLCFGDQNDPEEVVILGEIGPAAKDAVPCLIKLLGAEDGKIRAAATEALRKIDPEAAVKALDQAPPARTE